MTENDEEGLAQHEKDKFESEQDKDNGCLKRILLFIAFIAALWDVIYGFVQS